MLELILSLIVIIIVIYGQGIIFNKLITNKVTNIDNFNETFIFGIIFLSFVTLILNFFFPINKEIGSFLLLISFIFFFHNLVLSKSKKKIFIYILILAIISFLLISYSTINRPDAGLYHLPYTSVINENKIIFGITNLHFRFGHISIIQYLSSAFNNYILPIEAITIPISIIFSSFIYFIYEKLNDNLKKNKIHLAIILFLLTIFSIYSFNRYSEYGNDTPSHIFFSIFFIYIILQNKFDLKFFSKVVLISTYLFTIKPFMFILSLLVFYLFIKLKNKKKILFDRTIIFSAVFLIVWILKNLITSGCIIYPVSKTCLKNLSYLDLEKTKLEEVSGESWSKDFPNYKEGKYELKEYIKNFRWVSTWSKKHLKVIMEKFGPFLLFLILFYVIFSYNRDKKDLRNNKKYFCLKNHEILIFSFFTVLIWFMKFPLYRYGSSFLSIFFIFIFYLLIKNFNFNKKLNLINNIMRFTLILALFGFTYKNLYRIITMSDDRNPFPQIYSLSDNYLKRSPQKFKKITLNNGGYYFFSGYEYCMYSSSPCTHIKHDDIGFSEKLKYYKVFYKN